MMSRPWLARIVPFAVILLAPALACCGYPVRIGRGAGGQPAWEITPGGRTVEIAAGDRTLDVGPDRALKLPSQAAAVVRDGNTVLIEPGNYDDCAVWRANHLTVAAQAPGVVFTGKACQGKAIFVISGNDVTVRGITFRNATVPDHNGAGIRAEGRNLTVEGSRFIDNQEGILAGQMPGSTIQILDSAFSGNGTCQPTCAHALYIGEIAELDVENSRFTDTIEGHDIKSRALRTVLAGNDISDGPSGHSSYLIDIPNGGDLLMENNKLSKGPHTDNTTTAVMIGEEGATHLTHSLAVRNNSFNNLLPSQTAFVVNRTAIPADLSGNHLTGQVVPLMGPGTVR